MSSIGVQAVKTRLYSQLKARVSQPPIKGRDKPDACGTLRIKMPSARHEMFKQFTSSLMNDMWYDEKFVPKEIRGGHNIIADAGSPGTISSHVLTAP